MTSLRVRVCERVCDVGPDDAWAGLRARPPASLTASRPWVSAAFDAAHPEATPFLLAGEDHGRVVALLPLALHDRRTSPVLRVAGAPHNDLTDVAVRPGYEEAGGKAIIGALASAATRGWEVSLDDVDPDGVLPRVDRAERVLAWVPGDPATAIDLHGPWRSAASSHRRHAWRRHLRRLRDRHTVRWRRVQGPDARRRLPYFVDLRDAWSRAYGRDELPPTPFLEQVVHGLAPAGACAFTELLVDGHLVASDLYLLDRPVAMQWLRARDPAWEQFSPGHQLLRVSAERLLEDGFDIVDLGRGDESYKFLYGAKRRVLLHGHLQAEPREATDHGAAS